MIPRTFHRIWVGNKPRPKAADVYWEKFRSLHPGWDFVTWADPTDQDEFELSRLFASCQHPAQMADLMRIEIIYRHGGIYVDVDVEPLRSFEPLLQHDFFVVGCELFGGRALHPAARALLDRLQQYDTLPSDVPINVTTGPVLWRTTLFEPELFPGVVRPPFELFAPWTYEEKADRRRITSETFAVNHWFASWVPKPPLHQRALERGHRLGSRAKRLLRRR